MQTTDTHQSEQRDRFDINDLEPMVDELSDDLLEHVVGGMLQRPTLPGSNAGGDPACWDPDVPR